ncbi:hypothetical protein Tco_1403711 [Tanacetum coccineum]
MWENAKIVAQTPNSAIVQPNVDDNFVINSTHMKMIWENKFDGYLRADPHDQIREFLAICDMFKYGETQSEAAMDSQIISLNEELQDIRNKYNELREVNASKNHLNDDTPMCECHEANYIRSEDYQNQDSHNLFFPQSHYDPKSNNDPEKSLTELNNDVKNDLEVFKRCISGMRTVHWKLFARDDGKTTGILPNKESKTVNQEPQYKTDLEKSITKFLDDMIIKMKKNEKNCQTKIKNMERKMDGWEKYQNISSEQIDRTDPPPPQAQTEQVNVVFTESGKF